MGRKIVVSSNCQTGGLAAALAAMLPDDSIRPEPWIGDDASEVELRRALVGADVWVTAADPGSVRELVGDGSSSPRVLAVPRVLFGGFQPDTVYAAVDEQWIASPVARMHSAIVLWGWRHGLAASEIVELFTPAVMHGLGYASAWNAAVDRLRDAVEVAGLDFGMFFLPLPRRECFMLTVNHPRIVVLVQIARQVARELSAEPAAVDYPWETTLPDRPAMFGPVWPVYPVVAETLGLRGGFVWRNQDGRLLRLDQFVAESVERYGQYQPDDISIPALDDPRFDAVLAEAAS